MDVADSKIEEVMRAYMTALSPDEAYRVLKEHQALLLSERVHAMLEDEIAKEYKIGDNKTARRLEMHMRLFDVAHIRGIDPAWQRFHAQLEFVKVPGREEAASQMKQRLAELSEITRAFLETASSHWPVSYLYAKKHPELLRDEVDFILQNLTMTAKAMNDAFSARTFEGHRELLQRCREIGVEEAYAEKLGMSLQELNAYVTRETMPAEVREVIDELLSVAPDNLTEEIWSQLLLEHPDLYQRLVVAERLAEVEEPIPPELQKRLAQAIMAEHGAQTHPMDTAIEQVLDSWMSIYRQSDFSSAPDSVQVLVLDGIAKALLQRYDVYKHPADLDDAIRYWNETIELTSPDSPKRPQLLSSMSDCLSRRYELSRSVEDLEALIAHNQEAVDTTPSNSPLFPTLLNNLGLSLYARYERFETIEDLKEAVFCYETALHYAPETAYERVNYLTNLGNAKRSLYNHTGGQIIFLRQAIESYKEALQIVHQDDPAIAACFTHLGNGLADLFIHERKLEDLEEGIRNHIQAVVHALPDAPAMNDYLTNVAIGLAYRYQYVGEMGNLEQAIEIFQYVLDHTPSDSPDFPDYLINLATALHDRYDRLEELGDLERSIAYVRRAIDLVRTQNNLPALADYLAKLGSTLRNLYADVGKEKYLKEALEVTQQALRYTPQGSLDLLIRLNGLATILIMRYDHGGILEDLNEAIDLLETALSHPSANATILLQTYQVLSEGLKRRYNRTRDIEDIRQAINYLRMGLQQLHPSSTSFPLYLGNLGSALRIYYLHTKRPEDLNEAIEVLEQATQNIPVRTPGWAGALNYLGNCLRDRYKDTKNPEDLDRSIATLQETERIVQTDIPTRPIVVGDLALSLQLRYERIHQPEDLEEAKKAYQEASQKGKLLAPDIALRSAYDWGNWATEREEWDEAAEAYASAITMLEQLYSTQLLRASQEAMLSNVRSLHAKAAYAQARAGHLKEAVVTLEQGRARNLSQVLARDYANLKQLQQEHPEMYDQYQQAAESLRELEQVERRNDLLGVQARSRLESRSLPERMLAAREQMAQVIADSQQIAGYEKFLALPTFSDIQSVVTSAPLIYCAATDAGGFALILHPEAPDDVTPLWLSDLTEETLNKKLYRSSPQESYFLSYSFYRAAQDVSVSSNDFKTQAKQYWFEALDQITQWLWEVLMGPLVAAVAPASQVTLIPTGMLGLLPLHAAWREDSTSPTHRHYALDDITITYAPNARSIAVAKDIAILTTWDHLLAVDEPQPVAAGPLTYSEGEVQSALSTFAHHHVLRHEQATREAVLEAVRRYQVFHFSCHGYANFNEPLTSGLVMANNIPLTLGDLFELRLKGARLALLSACETGMTDVKLPDEVVSLSSGLLQAGVAGVIAPLWAVDQPSTLILMARYYDLWREEGLTPFEALRQAQIWVRDSTNKEKADYFKRFLPEFGASKTPSASVDSLYKNLGRRELNDRDFAHPYYWAAFGYTGV